MSLLKTKHKKSSALGRVLLNMLLIALILLQTMGGATADAVQTVADSSTLTMWEQTTGTDTKNIGRIWTDKSVSTESVTLPGGDAPSVAKGDSDFLVVLSALSSAGTITGETTSVKPLDIVLVLDTSGSMGDNLTTYTYTEVYSNQVNENSRYYAKVKNADGTETYNRIEYDRRNGYTLDRQRVYPKENSNDTAEGHIQFYLRQHGSSIQKLQALKNAANAFIDSTATENLAISDDSKKHRISLVTFATSAYTRHPLTICDNINAANIKSTINGLNADGATAADYAMANAKNALDQARADAQKVVIFFTDGEPNHYSGFDYDVANDTITAAKSLKDQGVKIYSIGMFAAANPGNESTNDSNQFNAYMHGVSSNYPQATAWNSLGDRATDADGNNTAYYKAASSADELNKIFDEIFTEINTVAPSSPVVNGTNGTENMEAITFHDELGDYMKVDDFKAIIFADKKYEDPVVSENGNTTTYTFEAQIDGGVVYPTGNLNTIEITVEHFPNNLAKGDIVTVVIPASMIPLREYVVDTRENDKKMTIDETYPLRIFYGASLKDGVEASLANPDSALQAYIADNTDSNGFVNFYSNKYYANGTNNGGVYVDFEPNKANAFYYFQEDEILYTGTAPANTGDEPGNKQIATGTLDTTGNTIYYYDRLYYSLENGKPVEKHNWVQIPGNSNLALSGFVKSNEKGLYVPSRTPRTTSLETHALNKTPASNQTGTATYVTAPNWDDVNNPKDVIVKLGNNGKLSFGLPGTLKISKAVTAGNGTPDPDAAFTFDITLGSVTAGQYTAQKFNAAGAVGAAETVAFANGKAQVTLKAEEWIEIYGLPAGSTYTVTEVNMPDGFKLSESATTGTTGTIAAGTVVTATFTNTYSAGELIIHAEDFGLKGTKHIDGRAFKQGDIFKFDITASAVAPNSPVPSKGASAIIKPTTGEEEAITFGEFKFTQAGHYRYSIKEYLPTGNGAEEHDKIIPGITYDTTNYRLTLDVVDNGKGVLTATNVHIDKNSGAVDDDAWTPVYPTDGHNGAGLPEGNPEFLTFTNTYVENSQTISLAATKSMDKLLTDYSMKEQFGFVVEAGGSRTNTTDSFEDNPLYNQPMPQVGANNKYIYRNDTTGKITIPRITFTAGNTPLYPDTVQYLYRIRELQPTLDGTLTGAAYDNAQFDAETQKWTYKGVTFDNTVKEVIVTAYHQEGEDDNGNPSIIVTAVIDYGQGNTSLPPFVNAYHASDETTVAGKKTLTGRAFQQNDEFTFNIVPKDNAPLPVDNDGNPLSSVTITPVSGDEATIDFGTFKFDDDVLRNANATKTVDASGHASYEKTFQYTITEADTDINGITYDPTSKTLSITVKDDGYGNMTVEESSASTTPLEWENTYAASPATFSGIKISKTLTGRSMTAGEFTFTITPQAGTSDLTDPADKEFSNVAKASGVEDVMTKLSSLKFTQADAGKTFSYLVDEAEPADDDTATLGIQSKGVTYDQSQYRVDLTPTDNGNGAMSVAAQLYRVMTANGVAVDPAVELPADQTIAIAFNNTYAPNGGTLSGRDYLMVTKVLTGRANNEWLDTDSFTFQLKLTKTPDGYQEGDVVLPVPATVTIDKQDTPDGNGYKDSFGNIIFNKVGTYGFTVSEVTTGLAEKGIVCDTHPIAITIVVTDPGNGMLEAKTTAASPALLFNNEYRADVTGFAGLSVEKTLPPARGWKDTDSFSFVLEGYGALTVQAIEDGDVELPKSNEITILGTDASKTQTFGSILFKQAGEYSFTVTEKQGQIAGIGYDVAPKVVTIVVKDNHAGGLVAKVKAADGALLDSATVTVANTYTAGKADPVVLRAFKILKNATLQDGQFTFVVKDSQGAVAAEGKNDAKGNVVFAPLMFETVGTYSFTVSEVNGGQPHIQYDKTEYALTITISDDGSGKQKATVSYAGNTNPAYTPVFVNTYDPSGAEDVKPPQTGDNSHVTLWIALLCVSCAGILGAAVYSRRKKQQG